MRTAPSTQPGRSGRHDTRLAALLLGAAGLILAACGSPTGSDQEGAGGRAQEGAPPELPECPLDALEEAEGTVRVSMWYGGIVEPPVGVLNSLIEEFNASQDQIVVTADDQGVSYDEVLRQYERTAATPAQLPDIIYMEDKALGQMVDRGQILPAQSCMEADGYDPDELLPAARAAGSVDGVLYPGYMNVSSSVLYYNQSHFQEAGLDPGNPPETIDELEAAARQIREAGVAPRPLSFVANESVFQTWLGGIGVQLFDNDNGRSAPATQAMLDDDDAVALLEWLDRMNDEQLLNPFPATEGSIDHYLALITQQSSMLIETSTASGTIAQALGGEISAEDAGVDVDPALLEQLDLVPGSAQLPGIEQPGRVDVGGGYFYLLDVGAPEEQAAAWKFLRFMLEPENSKRWHIEGGYLPVVASVLDDPDVTEFQASDLGGVLIAPSARQVAGADPDRPAPLIGPFTEYKRALRGALEAVVFSAVDPADALATANRAMNRALDDYNR